MDTTRRSFLKLAGAFTAGAARAGSIAGGEPENRLAWTREIPVRYDCDVAVIGGGMAGVSAALAAAKSGARVILAERFAVAGGNATIGGVASFCGETADQGEAFDAIIEALQAFDAIEAYRPYPEADNRKFDSAVLAVVLQELMLRRGVKLLLHTQFVDAQVDDGRITHAVVSGPSGPEALRAKVFIDTSGEAALARSAGVETMKGRPEDGLQLPMSMMFFVRHVAEKDAEAQVPAGWFSPLRKREDLPMTSLWPDGPRGNALKIKIPMFDATDTQSLTAAEIQGRRRMMEVLDYYQRVEEKNWRLNHCASRIGIREGCRVKGDYVLELADLRAARTFEDAIARGVYALDGHKPDDDKRTYILPKEERFVPPYQIPFRALAAEGTSNLLAAGRCFSADQLALSSARVMTTCAMTGQAAGIAAAMAADNDLQIRDLDYAVIRKTVEDRGAELGV
jgi:hypothetical protein